MVFKVAFKAGLGRLGCEERRRLGRAWMEREVMYVCGRACENAKIEDD
jgi:hypothetical protein